MDIFTDASFDKKSKVAGIGVVYVTPSALTEARETFIFSDCVSASNIHSAEMWAIAFALKNIKIDPHQKYRLFTDSDRAAAFIEDGSYIDLLGFEAQKEIDDVSVEMTKNKCSLQFYTMVGHRKGQGKSPFILYNKIADKAAKSACERSLQFTKEDAIEPSIHTPRILMRRGGGVCLWLNH